METLTKIVFWTIGFAMFGLGIALCAKYGLGFFNCSILICGAINLAVQNSDKD